MKESDIFEISISVCWQNDKYDAILNIYSFLSDMYFRIKVCLLRQVTKTATYLVYRPCKNESKIQTQICLV